uniref:EamA family transporter n=1 Tax=Ignisphaera aggregans TaxID=334771 RepID=A0A7J3N0P9_9CREN
MPSLVIAPWTILYDNPMNIVLNSWMYIIYLAIACSIVASLLQVIGQRYVAPAIASVIYLLEPFFALLFSISLYGEEIDIVRIVGGIMIVLASYIAMSYAPNAYT